MRAQLKRGPRRLAGVLGLPASTVHAILIRHGLHRLAALDPPSGQLIGTPSSARTDRAESSGP
jgi:hypothetical protein